MGRVDLARAGSVVATFFAFAFAARFLLGGGGGGGGGGDRDGGGGNRGGDSLFGLFSFAGLWLYKPLDRWLGGIVRVGDDGFRIVGHVRARFVAFRDVGRVAGSLHGVRVDLRSGEVLDLRVPVGSSAPEDALHGALEAGLACVGAKRDGRDGRDADHVASALDRLAPRRGLATAAWLARLREVGTLAERGAQGYRDAATPRDALMRLALDPVAPSRTRVAAVLALRAAMSDDDHARVRVSAERSLSPLLRVTLEPRFFEASAKELARALDGAGLDDGRGDDDTDAHRETTRHT